MLRRKLSPMLLGSAIAAIAVAGPAQAFEASFGGQVDRMMRYGNNGEDTDVQHLDNGVSDSRIHFTGSGELMDSVIAGVFAEVGLISNETEAFNINLKSPDTLDVISTETRWAEIFFETQWGKFSAGKGEEATRGIPYMSLAGTELVDGNDFRNWNGINFQDDGIFEAQDCNNGAPCTFIGTVFNNYDGLRANRLRYDTPNMEGFVGSASTGNDSNSVALRYHGQFDMVEFLAGAGWNHDQFDQDNFTITASGLIDNGFNITGSYGHRSRDMDSTFFHNDGHSSDNWMGMLGYRINDCAFSVSYGRTNDEEFDGDKATRWGVGFQKHFPTVNMDAYIGWQHFDFDGSRELPSVQREENLVDFQPSSIWGVLAGARIKF